MYGNPDGGDLSHRGVDPGIKSTRHIIKVTPSTAPRLIVSDGKTSCVPSNTTSIFYGGKSYQDYLMADIVTLGKLLILRCSIHNLILKIIAIKKSFCFNHRKLYLVFFFYPIECID